jgi:hypothetical protein
MLYIALNSPFDSNASTNPVDKNPHHPILMALNTADLTVAAWTPLNRPDGQGEARVHDDSSSAPMVGPDDDVYYGALTFDNHDRGFMMHFDKMLTTRKICGAFGWDDTASVVPASLVPSYTGTSSYLILTKYNNYADPGVSADGENKLAILDPNDSQHYDANTPSAQSSYGATFDGMKEVITLLGLTPNSELNVGVREWCINTAAVDPFTKSAIVNSEDGSCYRWDFTTNSATEVVNLTSGVGEAYTPTCIGKDGLTYAINNAYLYAMWDNVKPSTVATSSSSIPGGSSLTGTLTMSDNATGPGSFVTLSVDNAAASVPASVTVSNGSSTANFTITTSAVDTDQTVTLTASRYGFSASTTFTVASARLNNVTLSASSVYGGTGLVGVVRLNANAPSGGASVTLSSSDSTAVQVPSPVSIAAGTTNKSFNVTTSPVDVDGVYTITASYNGSTAAANVTVRAAALQKLTLARYSVYGGVSTYGTAFLTGKAGPSGVTVNLSSNNSAASVPGSSTVGSGTTTKSFTVNTSPVGSTTNVTISGQIGAGTVATVTLQVLPAIPTKIVPRSSTITGGTSSYAVLYLNGVAGPGGVTATLSSSNTSAAYLQSTFKVPAGSTTGIFPIYTRQVLVPTPVTLTATANGSSAAVTVTITP